MRALVSRAQFLN